jgi:hypothetical protein
MVAEVRWSFSTLFTNVLEGAFSEVRTILRAVASCSAVERVNPRQL